MKPLTKSLKTAASKIDDLRLDKLEWFLKETFEIRQMSVPQIAKLCDTYPNKIRRMLQKCDIKTRSRSEAQSVAIQQGRHPHPTKGTKRPEQTKIAISESASKTWANLTEEEQAHRSQIGKDLWNAKTPEEQQKLRNLANEGIRKAAKDGSKLEKFLLKELMGHGYRIDFHKEHLILNVKLHIDLFLREVKVAIEVDGPSHFEPVWGEDVLRKTQAADRQKDGLLLDAGYVVLRVQQRKSLSSKYKRDIINAITDKLTEIENKFPKREKRHIVIGEF